MSTAGSGTASGGVVDFEKAYFYYSKLESDRHPIALYRLGIMSETGNGTSRDVERARTLYRYAAERKNIYACKNWGVLEVKRGNPLGLVLWASAFVQGTLLSLIKPHDARLRIC
jgi:TPR repeat protein